MARWGTSTSNENKPTWLTDAELENCFATENGWVLRHRKGTSRYWDELLVAIPGLATSLGASDVTEIFFSNSSSAYVQTTNGFVTVVFNEAVTITGGTPTVLVQGGTTNATASYVSGNNTNKVVFEFTVPETHAGQTLFIRGQSIGLGGGRIYDSSNVNVTVSFANSIVTGVTGTAGADANVAVAGKAVISAATFGNTAYDQAAAGKVTLSFDLPITVTGSPTVLVNGGTTNATATYANGSGSNTLNFAFTVPSVSQTIKLNGQTVSLAGGTLLDATGLTANLVFANSVTVSNTIVVA